MQIKKTAQKRKPGKNVQKVNKNNNNNSDMAK